MSVFYETHPYQSPKFAHFFILRTSRPVTSVACMRQRPPRSHEKRTSSSSYGASSNRPSASASVAPTSRKPGKTGGSLIGGDWGVNGSVGGNTKGGIAKVRKGRDRSLTR